MVASPAAQRWATALAVAIILGGAAVRVMMLEKSFFSFDEAMHLEVAREATLTETYQAGRAHTHPPLIFLLYHLWLPVGDSEFILRIPSLICGVLGLCVAYLWLRAATNAKAALVGLFVLAFTPAMIELAIEMRGYTLWLLFLFAGLYCREVAFQRQSVAGLAWMTIWLALAMLTHYATAWVLFVLGVLTLIRLTSGRDSRRLAAWWIASQVLLAGLTGVLLIDHAIQSSQTRIAQEMWIYWLEGIPFKSGRLLELKRTIWSLFCFHYYIFGSWWVASLPLIVIGAVWQYRETARQTGSRVLALAASGLAWLPLSLGVLLFVTRVYPLGASRHSAWLLPSVALTASICCVPLLRRWPRGASVAVGLALLVWAGDVTVRRYLLPPPGAYSPPNLVQLAEQFRERIPRNEPVVTDGLTYYVLDYYLDRCALHERRDLGHGYAEHFIDGYRIITVPGSHLSQVNLKDTWPELVQALGEQVERPVWVVYFGFNRKEKELRKLAPSLPVGRWITRHPLPKIDGEMVRVQLRAPATETAANVKQTPLAADRLAGKEAGQ
jgi:hypothetical protein